MYARQYCGNTGGMQAMHQSSLSSQSLYASSVTLSTQLEMRTGTPRGEKNDEFGHTRMEPHNMHAPRPTHAQVREFEEGGV